MTYNKLIALALIVIALSSCGNRGELYLPENGKPAHKSKSEAGK
jgi:predicted small lipoprotein YifL